MRKLIFISMPKRLLLLFLTMVVVCSSFQELSALSTILFEGFEGGAFPPSGWTMFDEDGDGHDWELNVGFGNTGSYSISSRSWDPYESIPLNPDNYLITPALTLPIGTLFIEYYVFISSYYPDTYSVMISTTTPTIGAFVSVFTESHIDNGWIQRQVDISEYGGQTIYIAFRHHDSYNEDQVAIDDIRIYQMMSNDLAALSLQGDMYIPAGLPTTHTFTIRNDGLNTAEGYTVALKQGETVLATATGVSLPVGQTHSFPLSWTPVTEGNSQIYGEIIWEADENPANNQTSPFAITVLGEGVIVAYIGNLTNNWWGGSMPIDVQSPSSVLQMICLDSELPDAGILTELRFTFSGSGSIQENVPVQIYLAHTNKNGFDDLDFIPTSDMTQVFDGNISLSSQGIYNVDFVIEPFTYVGGNLAIMVYKEWLNNTPFYNDNWLQSSTGGQYRSIYASSESIIDVNNLENYNPGMTNVISNTVLLFTISNSGDLSGVVSYDGVPIEGALVEIENTSISVYTNHLGQYSVQFLLPGSIRLKVSMIGYYDDFADVSIIVGQNTVQNFTLTPLPTYTVSGKLISSDTSQPLSGVRVYLTGYAPYGATDTNAQGEFSFIQVFGLHEYVLVGNKEGYNELQHPFEVASADVNLGDIMIYENTYPVRFLFAEEVDDYVKLSWAPPKPPVPNENWFSHAGSDLYRGVGTANNDWIMINRFSVEQLEGLGVAGAMLDAVGFGLDSNSTVVSLDIHVYTGGSADPLEPGDLVYVQSVPVYFLEYHVWNEIELDTPVAIPTDKEMWIGIRASTQGYPFMTDELAMVHNYGNVMYSRGSWTTLYDQNPTLTYNWSIKGKATINGQVVSLSPISYDYNGMSIEPIYSLSAVIDGHLPVANPLIKDLSQSDIDTTSRSFESYNVYRATRETINNPALWTTLATNHTELEFADHTVKDLPDLTFYRYIVRAVYSNNNQSAINISNQIIKKPKDMDYIGNPSSNLYAFPGVVNLAFESSLSQTIYHENEFTQQGKIIDIMLTVRTEGNFTVDRDYSIFMAISDREAFWDSNDWHPYSDFTLVWRGKLPLTGSGIYDIIIKLDTPFEYDGGNLIVMGYGEYFDMWNPFVNTQISRGYTSIRTIFSEGHNPIAHPENSYPTWSDTAYSVSNMGFFFEATGNEGEELDLPIKTNLHGNFPNPFNPITTISFDLAVESIVSIDIFNIRGQRVKNVLNEHFGAGYHSVDWNGTDENGRDVSSGIYFYRMKTEEFTGVRRMVLLK